MWATYRNNTEDLGEKEHGAVWGYCIKKFPSPLCSMNTISFSSNFYPMTVNHLFLRLMTSKLIFLKPIRPYPKSVVAYCNFKTVFHSLRFFQMNFRNPETYVLFEQKPFFCLILVLIVFQHLFSIKIEVIAREYKPSLPLFFIQYDLK
jgi:hypothetical protein